LDNDRMALLRGERKCQQLLGLLAAQGGRERMRPSIGGSRLMRRTGQVFSGRVPEKNRYRMRLNA